MMNEPFSGDSEKFFFHMNVFDDELLDEEDATEEEPEDLPPPPPVFTLEELEAAKAAAYSNGYAEGQKEERASREQILAGIKQNLEHDIQRIFESENTRSNLFEVEVLALCTAIFEKLFPLYFEKSGNTELKEQIKTVLTTHRTQELLTLHIHSEHASDIEAFIKDLYSADQGSKITVISDDSMPNGSFRMQWPYGGATYSIDTVAEQIHANLKEMLASSNTKSHDSIRNISDDVEDEAYASETSEVSQHTVPDENISIAEDDHE